MAAARARTGNPFDLNLARAYAAPESFCPRPALTAQLTRATASQLWTLIVGERRMGKSSSVIATAVGAGWPVLHVDLMGVRSEEEVAERFRWGWQFFVQQASRGFLAGIKPELSAKIPGTKVEVKLAGETSEAVTSWGDVLTRFDRWAARRAHAVLFIDEFQDLANLPDEGRPMTRSLRAALQMTHHVTPLLAGSAQHLLASFFATAADAFFKSIRLQYALEPFAIEEFSAWAGAIFKHQQRLLETSAVARLYELTGAVTEDLVAVLAEVWVDEAKRRAVTPADIEFAWRKVVATAAPLLLPKVSALPGLQSRLLRYLARHPQTQPYAADTLTELDEASGAVHKALARLKELELVRETVHDGRKRVSVADARLAFYLQT